MKWTDLHKILLIRIDSINLFFFPSISCTVRWPTNIRDIEAVLEKHDDAKRSDSLLKIMHRKRSLFPPLWETHYLINEEINTSIVYGTCRKFLNLGHVICIDNISILINILWGEHITPVGHVTYINGIRSKSRKPAMYYIYSLLKKYDELTVEVTPSRQVDITTPI